MSDQDNAVYEQRYKGTDILIPRSSVQRAPMKHSDPPLPGPEAPKTPPRAKPSAHPTPKEEEEEEIDEVELMHAHAV
jgi:hypothetical protein